MDTEQTNTEAFTVRKASCFQIPDKHNKIINVRAHMHYTHVSSDLQTTAVVITHSRHTTQSEFRPAIL